jgi:hypothetical protein
VDTSTLPEVSIEDVLIDKVALPLEDLGRALFRQADIAY